MAKRIFAALLLCLLFSLVLAGCTPQEEATPDGGGAKDPFQSTTAEFTFTMQEDGTWAVSKGTMGGKREIVIPATHQGIPVTAIADSGFRSSAAVTIAIPDTVTHIGYAAFAECTSLSTITLPPSLTHLPDSAFLKLHLPVKHPPPRHAEIGGGLRF